MTAEAWERAIEHFALAPATPGRHVLTDDAQRAIDAAESEAEDRAEWAGYATGREMDEAGDKYHDRDERGAIRLWVPLPFVVGFIVALFIQLFGWTTTALIAVGLALISGLAIWVGQRVVRLEAEVMKWRKIAARDSLAAEHWHRQAMTATNLNKEQP